mgnify:FL=1|jgi:hypothetical protein
MKRPMKKAVGFLTALAYSTALFCAASMTAAAEDTHGNNQGGTTADDTWNTYTTSKVLDSVNTVAVFGDQFSLYFEAADYSGTSFTFSPDTIVTMVTKDGTSTRLRSIDNIDTIYRVISGTIMQPIAQSSTAVSEVHTVLTGANATSSGGYIFNEGYSYLFYSDKSGGYGVILPNGTLLEDGKTFDEVYYGGMVNVRDGSTYYFYDLDGNLISESSTDIGRMEFYDEHTGITVYSKANSDRYRDVTYTMYTSSGDSIGNISYNYINNIKSVIGSDGNYYVAVPYDSNWYTNDYSYDYYSADGKPVSADLFEVKEEETTDNDETDYSRETVTVDTYNDSADEYGIREYVVEDPSGRIVYTYKGRDLGYADGGFDKGTPEPQNITCQFFNGKLYLATTEGLAILDAYTGDLIARNTDFSYYGFDYMSSEGGHLIMSVGDIVDSSWGRVYESTGVVLLNLDGTLLSDKYETMEPTAAYTSHTSFIVSRTDPTINEKRYGMISGRGNLVVQLIYTSVYYSDSDITIFNRPNSYQDVFSSPTGKQYASEIVMRGDSYNSIKYYNNYILLLTTDKYSKNKIGAVVIR